MCCEQLVCAVCSRRVSEARCTVCREYRDAHHGGSLDWTALILPLLTVLVVLLSVLAWYGRVPG